MSREDVRRPDGRAPAALTPDRAARVRVRDHARTGQTASSKGRTAGSRGTAANARSLKDALTATLITKMRSKFSVRPAPRRPRVVVAGVRGRRGRAGGAHPRLTRAAARRTSRRT